MTLFFRSAPLHGIPLLLCRAPPLRRAHTGAKLPIPPQHAIVETPSDKDEARTWIQSFREAKTIPKESVEMTFARSSGPGGQNVNKVETKVIVRTSLRASWVPQWARPYLQASPYYVRSTDSLLLSSSEHRSQTQNAERVLAKLHSVILEAASRPVTNDPSQEQQERVRRLARAEDSRRKVQKDKRSQLKKTRSKRGWDD